MTQLYEEAAEEALLTFAEIHHPLLLAPMRVVTDHLPYVWRGVQWEPVLFEFQVTQDDDRPPEARISLPAIDRRIANALIDLPERARISFWIISSGDFDISQEPRVQIEEPVPLRSFLNLDLMDVQGNVSTASGRLTLRDTTREPWPGLRATASRCPGLFT